MHINTQPSTKLYAKDHTPSLSPSSAQGQEGCEDMNVAIKQTSNEIKMHVRETLCRILIKLIYTKYLICNLC